jgi:hypothetical protein
VSNRERRGLDIKKDSNAYFSVYDKFVLLKVVNNENGGREGN